MSIIICDDSIVIGTIVEQSIVLLLVFFSYMFDWIKKKCFTVDRMLTGKSVPKTRPQALVNISLMFRLFFLLSSFFLSESCKKWCQWWKKTGRQSVERSPASRLDAPSLPCCSCCEGHDVTLTQRWVRNSAKTNSKTVWIFSRVLRDSIPRYVGRSFGLSVTL